MENLNLEQCKVASDTQLLITEQLITGKSEIGEKSHITSLLESGSNVTSSFNAVKGLKL